MIELFRNNNAFMQNIDRQWDDAFAADGAKIGDTLRIRLPKDYTVVNGPPSPTLSAPAAVALGAAAVVVTNPVVSRRFWK